MSDGMDTPRCWEEGEGRSGSGGVGSRGVVRREQKSKRHSFRSSHYTAVLRMHLLTLLPSFQTLQSQPVLENPLSLFLPIKRSLMPGQAPLFLITRAGWDFKISPLLMKSS